MSWKALLLLLLLLDICETKNRCAPILSVVITVSFNYGNANQHDLPSRDDFACLLTDSPTGCWPSDISLVMQSQIG